MTEREKLDFEFGGIDEVDPNAPYKIFAHDVIWIVSKLKTACESIDKINEWIDLKSRTQSPAEMRIEMLSRQMMNNDLIHQGAYLELKEKLESMQKQIEELKSAR